MTGRRHGRIAIGALAARWARSGLTFATVLMFVSAASVALSGPITVNRTPTSAATSGTAATLSWPHTIDPGNNRILIVGLSLELGQATSVKYGVAPLTLIGRHTGGSSHTIELWRLVAPPVGTASILATFDSPREALGGATAFNEVHQASPTGTFAGNDGDSGTASVTVTSATDDLVIDTVFVDLNTITVSADGGQTERWNLANGRRGAGSTEAGAVSVDMSWSLSGGEEWTIAGVSLRLGPTISGVVFEDADFAGTASGFDGGTGDHPLEGVDVELYDAGTDAYISSTVTDANGNYGFGELPDGNYKVRVRSATIGSGTATPQGGLNATVPGTWPNPLPELAWANGSALYGGQSPTVDDTLTGDNAGPGDTWTAVTVSGSTVAGVDFGFAHNLIVNTLDDTNADNVRSTQGSLRQFLKNANAIGDAGGTTASSSQFRIPGAGPHTIQPLAALPEPDDPITIDGYTQPGASPNTVASPGATDATLLIELDGSLAGAVVAGLHLKAGNSTVRGLVINRFDGDGIRLFAFGSSVVEGNYIGTDTAGAAAGANTGTGVYMTSSDNTIGGASPGARNVISGNTEFGVKCSGSSKTDNSILGNYIGLRADGTVALTNGDHAVEMSDCPGNFIGAAGAGNVINAGFGERGIAIVSGSADGNEIRGNFIGTNAAGDTQLSGGTTGIHIFSGASTIVGGTAPGEGNVIAGYFSTGIYTSGDDTIVEGNSIGTDAAGALDLTNGGTGIDVDFGVSGMRIGGTSDAAGNFIAHNTGNGIRIRATADSGNQISRNSIFSNGGLGIDLNADGVTTNDDNDDDGPGPNDLLNFPVLDTAQLFGSNLELTGWARPDSVIELFVANSGPDDFGEGQSYKITLTEDGTGAGGEDPYTDLDGTASDYGPEAVNGLLQGEDTTNRFRFLFPLPSGIVDGTPLTATARDASNSTSEFSGRVTTVVAPADLSLAKTDSPDPAPLDGPLVYTLVVTNDGPNVATGVTVTDVLPASVNLQSATPSQGSCSGTTTITCNLGAIVATGTASVEILVTTTAAGMITNNASVTANEPDPVPADNAIAEDTEVVADSSILDLPLTQYRRIHGFVDYTVTGGSLRTQPNGGGGAACQVGPSSSATLSGIPVTATVTAAYLYWAGSGATVDADVTFDGGGVTADRTFQGRFSLGSNDYEFFGGFEDVTAQVTAKRNGSYSFADLTVDTANPYCNTKAVMAGWSLFVVYSDTALSGKTLVLYDGFDIERNGSASYVLTGIYSADPPDAKTTFLVWEGDPDLSDSSEALEFNGSLQSDGLNPVDNVYNSTINSLGSTTTYGLDLDTFDVSSLVSAGDTLATTRVTVGPDLVILNAVVLQAKSNIIVGKVFEDVNYGGGVGRNLATAIVDAPSFAVGRPGAVVELYDTGGTFLRTTVTDANGEYGYTGLVDGDYQVRVVNESVDSSRPSATGAEWPVQTFRTDASTGTALPVVGEIGGASPAAQDSPANVAMASLGTLTAQSVAPAKITTGIAVSGVDFGYNFDTVVNTNDSGQGSLRQFLQNASSLGNASLAQAGRTSGVETSLFLIPSDADPWGRPQDPNFDAGSGVATITLAGPLPAITDDATALDGTTQTAIIGDTNAGQGGNPELAGTSVGTGPDGIEGTGDELSLPSYPRPEIEIDGNDQGIVVDIAASNVRLRGLSLFNSPSAPAAVRVSAGTGSTIAGNFIGARADGTDPGAGQRASHGIEVFGGAADVTDNFIAYTNDNAIMLDNDSTVSGNEVYRAALGDPTGDGISAEGTTGQTIVVRGNRVDRSAAYGFESWLATGPFTVEDNTFSRSGEGGGAEHGGIRVFGTGSTIRNNVVTGSAGAGVALVQRSAPGSNQQNLVSQNAIYANGSIGIDLDVTNTGAVNPNGDGVTANDGVVDADLPNRELDYPVITSARMVGATLSVEGYVGTAATKIAGTHDLEFFKADDDGNNDGEVEAGDAQSVAHGEGRWFVDSCSSAADGSFDCDLTVPAASGLSIGDGLTATTVDASNNTSEFAASIVVAPGLAIVKRAFQLDGTPIANGSTLPSGMPVRFLFYINNAGGLVSDVSLQDVLDPTFGYQAGSLQADSSLVSTAVCPAGICDEAAIFGQVDGSGTVRGDGDALTAPIDADEASYDSGARTIHVGDGSNANNAPFDLPAGRVWSLVFTVTMN